MTYEVKTPILLEAVDAARNVIRRIGDGSIATGEAREQTAAARVLISACANDVKARLSQSRIAAIEAKTIENDGLLGRNSGALENQAVRRRN